ncbi:MAG: M1 family metallopeptidase [Myxococcota bacterium]
MAALREDKSPVDDEAPLGRLPDDVKPLGYDLTFNVDPRKKSFSGVVAIGIRLTRPRNHLWIHGVGLQVKQAQVTLADGSARKVDYQQLTPDGVVRIAFPRELEAQDVRLAIAYDAEFNTDPRGLYRVEEGGKSYAFTQFRAIAARRAFPCFDEPAFKTPFRVTVTTPSSMQVITTTSPEAQRASSDGASLTTAFRETEALPTYLIALAVGEFDIVNAEIPPNDVRERPIPLRGVAVGGKGAAIGYALENTGPILSALERYLGIPYPYEKIDIIAVPDFVAGAMENVGAITFQEYLLLFDPATASQKQLRSYAYVMAHQLAHQWFGNLVTMPWWDDLWLNESFATLMGYRALDQWKSEFGGELELQQKARSAMHSDSLGSARSLRQPITSNRDIRDALDTHTYRKGGAVLSMYERFLGRDVFRRGVAVYLDRFRHGNATAEDLMTSLTESSGTDVTGSFQSLLTQPGIPLLTTRLQCEGQSARLDLRQSRYLPLGSRADEARTWELPICFKTKDSRGTEARCVMMKDAETSIALQNGCPSWVMPNADGAGYYRFVMNPEATADLVKAGLSRELGVAERVALVDSLEASFVAGELAPDVFLDSLAGLASDPERMVVIPVLRAIAELRTFMVSDRFQPGVEAFARRHLKSRFKELGFVRRETDSADVQLFRKSLLAFLLFDARDAKLREQAAERGRALIDKKGLRLDESSVDVASLLLGAWLQRDGELAFETMVDALVSSTEPSKRRALLQAIGYAPDAVSDRARDLVLDTGLRINERFVLLSRLSESPQSSRASWLWLRENFREFQSKTRPEDAGRSPMIAAASCELSNVAALDEFFGERIERLTGGPRNLRAAIEAIELCTARVRALRAATEAYFGGGSTTASVASPARLTRVNP